MAVRSEKYLGCFWVHRMKGYIDKFQANASQANCFEGFWRITSKTKAKIR